MEITLTTPALLFSTLSLLLLAYTNRFIAIGSRIRTLYDNYLDKNDPDLKDQIESLRKRVNLIRNMQLFGIVSLFLCVLCMITLFAGFILAGKVIFAGSLIMLLFSLALSTKEILNSVDALNLHLKNMEGKV